MSYFEVLLSHQISGSYIASNLSHCVSDKRRSNGVMMIFGIQQVLLAHGILNTIRKNTIRTQNILKHTDITRIIHKYIHVSYQG